LAAGLLAGGCHIRSRRGKEGSSPEGMAALGEVKPIAFTFGLPRRPNALLAMTNAPSVILPAPFLAKRDTRGAESKDLLEPDCFGPVGPSQ